MMTTTTRARAHAAPKRALDPFAVLTVEMERTGWPERFQTDVTTHDRAALAKRDPSLPFAWILMRDGSYLTFPSAGFIDGAGHRAEDMPAIVARTFGVEECRFYWWDGRTLRDVHTARGLADCLLRALETEIDPRMEKERSAPLK